MEIRRLLDLYKKGPRVIPDYLTLNDSLKARQDQVSNFVKPRTSMDTLNGLFYERPDWVYENFPMSFKDFLNDKYNREMLIKQRYNNL